MAHPQPSKTESTPTPRSEPEVHLLEQRITTLERKVRFLMERLTRDELETYERVES